MTVNTRLQETPVLQRMPQNQREWTHYQNELAKWVRYIVKLGDGSLTTSGGTTISGLDEMPGVLAGGESIPTVNAFNVGCVQSTATPISAADVGSDVTITVAAHNVVYDNGAVAYNSGTITGLSFSTRYYVYTDDPTKAGGAVTYSASTTATDVTTNSGRYYVGEVLTPADGAAAEPGTGGGGGFYPP